MTWRQHLLAIIVLPFTVIVLVPFLLLLLSFWSGLHWMFLYSINSLSLILGVLVVAFGFVILYKTNWTFAKIGKGTLAPWAPTQYFVVVGLYRYVRNPMILGVLIALFGEAILFGSTLLLFWLLVFGIMNHVWFVRWEEPDLERRFGEEYRTYKANVPRWIPRRSAWNPNPIQEE